MSRVLMALTVVAACTACTGGAGDRTDEPSSILPTDIFVSRKPSPPPTIEQEVTGILSFDGIEGGCAYLESDDGTRHQVTYPEGWELHRSPLQLVSPEGEVVAQAGDSVTVRGLPAPDMATTCQIGPVFRATEVVRP